MSNVLPEQNCKAAMSKSETSAKSATMQEIQSARSTQIITAIPEVPITVERPVPEGLELRLRNPGLPRANHVADAEHPDGTKHPVNPRRTVLQQHVDFWDVDEDGVIWPWDVFWGFRELGYNLLVSLYAMLVVSIPMSYPTQPSWIPDPFFRIYTDNIHRAKHGSDSESYDTEGRFVPEKFEEIFSKFDKGKKDALTFSELWQFTNAMANALDWFGFIATKLEWLAVYILVGWKDGKVPKDKALGVFDGSLFYQVAGRKPPKHATYHKEE